MSNDKYKVANMASVIIYPIEGINIADEREKEKIDKKVESKVKEIVEKLKESHSKFVDIDFGPTEKDEFGAISFYGNGKPDPAGSKYPSPDTLKWERPLYSDEKFGKNEGESGSSNAADDDTEEEDEEFDEEDDDEYGISLDRQDDNNIWCKKGKLFLDGSSSGDVIQGQLGDCWFLSALAVLGADESLLTRCFWKADIFREFGVYVIRFFKDTNMIFVIIDDRLPVRRKDGKLIFAGSKDPNELWVPLIEKAYAKLHGCYKALIGGYTHYGLADMTGFCPRLIVLREGLLGFSRKYSPDEVWEIITRYLSDWKSLMGCSIQPNPKEKNKVEADAGHGLHMGHAYSLLAVREVVLDAKTNKKVRLLKLRNPWGRGEWEGAFGDRSEEYEKYEAQIKEAFNKNEREQEHVVQNFNDGTFFMRLEDWYQHYTSLFVAINFPSLWCGKRVQGRWTTEQGGNREMGTWITNPKFKFRLKKDSKDDVPYRQVFVGLYIKDSRMTLGYDYFKDPLYATPLTFDIVTEEDLNNLDKRTKYITGGLINYPKDAEGIKAQEALKKSNPTALSVEQPPYNFGTTQVEVFLEVEKDYYIIPSLYKRNQEGTFFLNIYADVKKIEMEGGSVITAAQKPMTVGGAKTEVVADAKAEGKGSEEKKADIPVVTETKQETLKMSVAQFYERKEALRERIVSESSRLQLNYNKLEAIFTDCKPKENIPRSTFKRRLMQIGFMLTDFPDDDLIVLDADNNGSISPEEFLQFYKDGVKFKEASVVGPPPEPPVDDLLFKSIDLSGELKVQVTSGRSLRDCSSWFSNGATGPSLLPTSKSGRSFIQYDVQEANQAREKAKKARIEMEEKSFLPPSKVEMELDPIPTPSSPRNNNFEGEDGDKLSALNSVRKSTNNNFNSKFETASVNSAMSLNQKELIKKAGDLAATKLHSDPSLQRAEMSRTNALALLRKTKNSVQQTAAEKANPTAASKILAATNNANAPDSLILRRKTAPKKADKKRDIGKDADAMKWLNYYPTSSMKVGSTDGSKVADNTPIRATLTPISEADELKAKEESKLQIETSTAVIKKPSAEVAASTESVTQPYIEGNYDLWDYLIDCVVTISLSRPKTILPSAAAPVSSNSTTPASAVNVSTLNTLSRHEQFIKMKRDHKIFSKDVELLMNQAPSSIPTPAKSKMVGPKPTIGHTPTPRSARKAQGIASVKTPAQQIMSSKNDVKEAMDKLQVLKKEKGASYEEIFRRLVTIPTTTYEEIAGERNSLDNSNLSSQSNAYIKSLFAKFDKNSNGFISKEEFKQAMNELNVEVSNEDCTIFFNRFRCHVPDNIDWKEFLTFFESHIMGSTSASLTTSSSAQPSGKSNNLNMLDLLMKVRSVLRNTMDDMKKLSIVSIEKLLEHQSRLSKVSVSKDNKTPAPTATVVGANPTAAPAAGTPLPIPDNAIFLNLSLKQAKTNAGILQSLGLTKINEENVGRISRIFDYNISSLMEFVKLNDVDLAALLDATDAEICKELSSRSGAPILRTAVTNPNAIPTGNSSANIAVNNAATVLPVNTPNSTKKLDHQASMTRNALMSSLSAKQLQSNSSAALLKGEGKSDGTTKATVNLTESTTASTAKLWSALAPNVDANVSFEILVQYFNDILADSSLFKDSITGATAAATAASPLGKDNKASKLLVLEGVKVDLLNRIVVDTLIYSSWNRLATNASTTAPKDDGVKASSAAAGKAAAASTATGASNKGETPVTMNLAGTLSFSGFDAYLRYNRILYIEQKLRYLMQLEANVSAPSTNLLVHVYLKSHEEGAEGKRGDEILIVADDPLSGELFTLQLQDKCFTTLPRGEEVKNMVDKTIQHICKLYKVNYHDNNRKLFHPDRMYFYNPIDTPVEDLVMQDMVKRLKLVRSRRTNKSELILAEDGKFVNQLKVLLDQVANTLPCFYIVNDLFLSFEVDDQVVSKLVAKNSVATTVSKKEGSNSIRSIIFSSIRQHKALHSFLTQVQSSLKVVLSTYNNSLRETFTWDEMLSHLTNHRNPFITVELLPRYIPPEKYLYEPEEVNTAFQGDDIDSEDDEDDEEEGKEADATALVPQQKHKRWQRGSIDHDGAPHPRWDSDFTFTFKSPKLSACKVLSTEVVKMLMEEKWKYVMVMIREGRRKVSEGADDKSKGEKKGSNILKKESFRFLTIYDPRSATEYQCGVKPNCKLYEILYFHKLKKADPKIEMKQLMQDLSDAADQNMLLLGPAITPRLEIQVYNYQDDKVKELLGQCQVSISSVLSGSGIGDKTWVTLTHKVDKEALNQLNGGTAPTPSTNGQKSADEKKLVDIFAGEIQVELGFRNSMLLEAERSLKEEKIINRRKSIMISAESKKKLSKLVLKDSEEKDETPRIQAVPFSSAKKQSHADDDDDADGIDQEEKKRLIAEIEKLRKELEAAKVSKTSKPLAVTATSGDDKERTAQLLEQVQKFQQEQAALVKEKDKIDQERQKGIQEIQALQKKLNDASKDDKKSDPSVDAQRAKELADEIDRLKKANEQLKAQLIQSPAVASKDASKGDALKIDTTVINQEGTAALANQDASFDALTRHLVQIFLSRYEKKAKILGVSGIYAPAATNPTVKQPNVEAHSHGALGGVAHPLTGLNRLLHSYATADGLIGYEHLMLALQELLIEITIEQANTMITNLTPNKIKKIQVHSVMEHLNNQLNHHIKTQRASGLLLTTSETPGKTPVGKSKAGAATAEGFDANKTGSRAGIPKPLRKSGTVEVSKAEEDKVETAPVAEGGKKRPVSAAAKMNSTEAKESKDEVIEKAETPVVKKKNIDALPLPEGWEKRFSKEHNRFFYINHANKSTQWHHPAKQLQQPATQHSGIDLNKTDGKGRVLAEASRKGSQEDDEDDEEEIKAIKKSSSGKGKGLSVTLPAGTKLKVSAKETELDDSAIAEDAEDNQEGEEEGVEED